MILTLTAGTALLMWMGELITQRGIGNGMSILIFASVVSTLPFQFGAVRAEGGNVVFTILILLSIAILVGIVFVEQGQRRIPVQFAKRVVGRRMYGGQSTYIPLKVNQAGVIPIIFASSMLYLPALLANVVQWDWLQNFVDDYVLNADEPGAPDPLRAAHRRLRLLLHRDRVRPREAGRHDPQAGRVHPRHPARAPDRALPRQDPEPDHAARRAVHRRHRHPPVDRARDRRRVSASRSAAPPCSSPSASLSRR